MPRRKYDLMECPACGTKWDSDDYTDCPNCQLNIEMNQEDVDDILTDGDEDDSTGNFDMFI